MLGAGVLGLPSAFREMGWAGATVCLVIVAVMSLYGGLLLGWLRGSDSSIHSYPALARRYARNLGPAAGQFWMRFTQIIGGAFILGSCTIYLVTCKISIMEVFQGCPANTTAGNTTCDLTGCTEHGIADIDPTLWLVITAATLFPLIHIRSLADASIVSYVGVSTIAIVNAIIVARCASDAIHSNTHPARSYTPSLMDFVNGLTKLAFAYGGHVLMIDIHSEMREPADWSKAVYVSQLFMFINYAIVG
jgi:proton-coupled amino acid transporter